MRGEIATIPCGITLRTDSSLFSPVTAVLLLSTLSGQESAVSGHPSSVDGPSDTIWALRDVSFEVKRGEVVGIIGRNGAGKSTLLKILSRITKPTTGFAEVHGRVGALLEVGTGFHPELSGRENVFLSGAILGMRKAEIERYFDEIVDFAGVARFIDTPVKRYSSGMYVRRAFAVAAHLDSDVLIIDEALAVGDAAFQKKSVGKLDEISRRGRTILLVSHNMELISSLTHRGLVLDSGQKKFFGDASQAVSEYLSMGAKNQRQKDWEKNSRPPGMTPAIIAARVTDGEGREREVFHTGEEWRLEVEYCCDQDVKLGGAGFNVLTSGGILVGTWNTFMGSPPPHRIPSKGKLWFRLSELPLCPGTYSLDLVLSIDQRYHYDKVTNALSFSVDMSDPNGTGYVLTHRHGLCAFNGTYDVETDESRGQDRILQGL